MKPTPIIDPTHLAILPFLRSFRSSGNKMIPALLALRSLGFCALVLVAAFPCLAADEEAVAATTTTQKSDKGYLPWEKGSVKFGGFISAFDSTLSFGVNHSVGVSFNAEELFDLESSLTVFRAEAMYRPGKSLRNQLDFTYASYERSGGATLSQDITINGVTYPVGAHVEVEDRFDMR